MVTNFDSDYVEASLSTWGLGLKARLMAAGWFAGAACVPVIFFFLLFWMGMGGSAGSGFRLDVTIWILWLFAAIPISAAALLGFTLGSQIIDPLYRTTAWRAALRGTLVAFFSYVLFAIACAVSVAASTDSSQTASLSDAASMMVMLFLFGFVFVGWLILIVGAFAGWLLYRVSNKNHGCFLDVPGETGQAASLSIVIAILVFLSNCAVLLLLGKPGQN